MHKKIHKKIDKIKEQLIIEIIEDFRTGCKVWYQEERMAEEYRGMAIGTFELDSECICFAALDAAAKAAVVPNPSQEMVDIVEMFKSRRRH